MLVSLPPRFGVPIWAGKGEPVPGEGGEPLVGGAVVDVDGAGAGTVEGAGVSPDGAAPPPPDNGVVGGTAPVGSGTGGMDGRGGVVTPRAPVTPLVAPVSGGRT